MMFKIEPYDKNKCYVQIPINIPVGALNLLLKDKNIKSRNLNLNISRIPIKHSDKIFSTSGRTETIPFWFDACYDSPNRDKILIIGELLRSPYYYGNSKYSKYIESDDISVKGNNLHYFIRKGMTLKPVHEYVDYE